MARPSKLTEQEWQTVLQRVMAGEPVRALAREYDIAEGAIRQRVKTQKETIISSAKQIVTAERKIQELPIYAQSVAFDYVSALRAITSDLARAAATGANNAARLHAIASAQLNKVEDPENLTDEAVDAIKAANAATQTANAASRLGVDLIMASKGQDAQTEVEPPKLQSINSSEAAKAYAAFIGK